MNPTKTALSAIVLTAVLAACSSSDDDETSEGMDAVGDSSPAGLVSRASTLSVPEAIGALQAAFDGNAAITALAPVDHQANAQNTQNAELVLRPTSVILFGNPNLGTPLMQANQQAGLDLPLKMLAFEGQDGTTQLSYNDPGYLRQRHALSGVDEQLATMTGALGNFATAAGAVADEPDVTTSVAPVDANQGVIVVPSDQDMESTYNTLLSAIEAAPPLNVFAQVDHGANAQNAGLDLRPTRLIIFGNPNLGTPLMQSAQSIGIDLPQKMLVFEDEAGQVSIAYNDPEYLASRHGITGQDDRLTTIATALGNLAANAAAAPAP